MAMAFVACDDDDVNYNGLDTEFKVSTEALNFLCTAADQNFYIVAQSTPQVTSDADWLQVQKVERNGNSEKVWVAVLHASEYYDYDNRTATVTVEADGKTAKVTVTQKNAEGVIVDDGSLVHVYDATEQIITVPVLATGEFIVEADSWIEYIPETRSLTENSVRLRIQANNTPRERSCIVRFILKSDPSLWASYAIEQKASAAAGACDETAFETAANIAMAINIGNTLEATGGETAWGAVQINADYINGICQAGFDAVRLPVAWYGHSDKSENCVIDADWMNRVEEVVNLCVSKGLYVFMNIHWDGGWMESNMDSYSADVDNIQRKLWQQIAERFNYFDKHLIFCGANEAGQDTQASADALKAYMQTFIDVVRATGGNNAERVLVVQAPGTDINRAVKYCQTLPTDVVADKLMLEVHCYDPSDFTIMSEDNQWSANTPVKYFWGNGFHSGTNRDCTWGEESHIDAQMAKLYDNFVSKGVPVFMGEFGCGKRTSFVENIDEDLHRRSRAYYHSYIVSSAKRNGVVPCLWDTPNEMFNRSAGIVVDSDNLTAIMEGAKTAYPF